MDETRTAFAGHAYTEAAPPTCTCGRWQPRGDAATYRAWLRHVRRAELTEPAPPIRMPASTHRAGAGSLPGWPGTDSPGSGGAATR